MWLPFKSSRRSLHLSCNKLASHTVRVLFFSRIIHDLLCLGRKCGSVFIDGRFKEWLRDQVLGPDDYEKLEPNTKKRIKPHSTTGRKMRDVMKVFIEHKCGFKGSEEHLFTIELPRTEFGDLNNDWVEEGLLTLDS